MARDLAEAVAHESGGTAQVLSWIAEFDARRLYLPAAYPTMYDYCLGELKMSEDRACKRIRAARSAREFPAIFKMVADGQLSLSAVLLLAPRLTPETSADLLASAANLSKAGIETLLAERIPRADVATTVRALPMASADESHAPAEPLSLGREEPSAHSPAPGRVVPSPSAEVARVEVPLAPRPRVAPLSPGRYELRATLDQGTHDKLHRVRELLSHSVPSGDLAEALGRALDLALATLEKRRFAATNRPSARRRSKSARHIPAQVRREVSGRDRYQCRFVSASGRRCTEKRFLEHDHVQPVARGGQATLENTRLRCRAHNQYEAERTYGAGFMREKRQAAKTRAGTARMLRGVATDRARMRADARGAERPGSAGS
jgi:hypothetical protein